MAVLLECAVCFQNYAVPKQSLGRPTTCPWCGASSLSDGQYAITPYTLDNVPAEQDSVRLLDSRFQRIGGRRNLQAESSEPAGTVGRPVVTGPVQLVLASLRYVNRGIPFGDARTTLAPFHASHIPRRDNGIPALLWLVIGVGIGACVVLAAVAIWRPDVSGRGRNIDYERRVSSFESSRTFGPAAAAGRSDDAAERWRNESRRSEQRLVADSAMRDDRDRELRLIRERMKSTAGGAGSEMQPKGRTPRWMSDRPPPIGDPGDDSPPLGFMLAERGDARTDRVAAVAQSNLAASERRADDPAAVKELVAAGIVCQKDSASGLITRVDGSFRMSDPLMVYVAKLPNVVQLKLSFSNVTDAGLAHVKDLRELKELILNETKITDAALGHIGELSKLEKLDLEKTQITDGSLAHLKKLRELKRIDLRGTKITPAGVGELKEVLPAARIRS